MNAGDLTQILDKAHESAEYHAKGPDLDEIYAYVFDSLNMSKDLLVTMCYRQELSTTSANNAETWIFARFVQKLQKAHDILLELTVY